MDTSGTPGKSSTLEMRAALYLAILAALVTFALILAGPARADTFAVTKTADTNDGDCAANDCSLREAVIDANAAPGADNINLAAETYALTIAGANEDDSQTGDLDVTGTVRVNGQGAGATAVSAGGDGGLGDRVFDVVDDASATITDLTVSGGRPPDDPGRSNDSNGGGISSLGAGDLELDGIAVRDNVAGTDGGGVYKFSDDPSNVGTLTITDSTVSGNTTRLEGGGICSSDSILTITGSTTSNNTAGNGGGIYSEGIPSSDSTLTMRDSTASNNVADSDGGGISAEEGTATIIRSTVIGNVADSRGGGIEGFRSALTIAGSTLSGNSTAGVGGGVYNDSGRGPGVSEPTTVRNSTFSGNSAGDRGGGYSNRGGVSVLENVTVTANTAPEGRGAGVASIGDDQDVTEVFSSVIAANDSTDVDLVDGASGPDGFVSGGYNVIGDGNATAAFSGPGDETGVTDPGLLPLRDNGGPTQTHALRAASPAVDLVAAAECPPPSTDQRGVKRPQNGDDRGAALCDSGSFELKAPTPPPPPPPPPPPDRPACSDGRDNDGDGRTDLRDPGCSGRGDDSERDPRPEPEPRCTVRGTGKEDVLVGTGGRDVICGFGGGDVVQASGGRDIVRGGGGGDTVQGGDGDDALYGGSGRDLIQGGSGRDVLEGGPGRDRLDGGPGRDTVRQ